MSRGVSVQGVSDWGVCVLGVNVQGVSVQGVSDRGVCVLGVSVRGVHVRGGSVLSPLGFIYVVPVIVTFWCSYCSQRLWKPSFAGLKPMSS